MPGLAPPAPSRLSGAQAPYARVRWLFYGAFVLLAVLALFQSERAHRLDRLQSQHAELARAVGEQGSLVSEIGRSAALLHDAAAPGSAHDLIDAVARSRAAAAALDRRIAESGLLTGRPETLSAAQDWHAARAELWRRVDARLGGADRDGETTAEALQLAVGPARHAVSRLADSLEAAAAARSETYAALMDAVVPLTLGVLVVLVVFLVEPAVRAARRQVRQLQEQTVELERMALVAARTGNVVVVTDPAGRITWANDAFVRLTGCPLQSARGQLATSFLSAEHGTAEAPLEQLREALRQGRGQRAELSRTAADGTLRWLDVDIQPLPCPEGRLRGYVCVAADITERRRLQEQLRTLARTDVLTGLPNRAVVLDRVQRAIEHARAHPGYGFAVLFMDFDRFKHVNDTLGHAAGDELLRQIAQRIERALRPGDAVGRVDSALDCQAARVGGDEFVVVLEGVRDPAAARQIAQRLLEDLARPYRIGGQTVQSAASIGVVTSAHPAETAEDVLRNADTAMYEAKRAGRGRVVCFDVSMQQRVLETLAIEADLRESLDAPEGGLSVVYQPVVGLDGGALVGVEALARWTHPVRGVVPPDVFVAVAEEAGLIGAVGARVLDAACAQLAAWRATLGDAAPAKLSVNLSRAQLQHAGLAGEVGATLAAHGLPPAVLELEVTESLAAQDERVRRTLAELKALGVRLALDDFGTGYSSLACLNQLPVDTVKIDRSFVAHAERVEYQRVLIEATIRVARTLGMTTVAEGIESPGQAALMADLRCDHGQGWLFGRPMDAAALADWVAGRGAIPPVPDAAPEAGTEADGRARNGEPTEPAALAD